MTRKKSRREDDDRPPAAWPDPEDDLEDEDDQVLDATPEYTERFSEPYPEPEPQPEPVPKPEPESVRQPKPGEVLPSPPYRPYGRHVHDAHGIRIATCYAVVGQTDSETAMIIAQAMNRCP